MNLDKELIDFLILDLPSAKIKPDTFLDLVGVQYHENTITQLYAYFLDRSNNKSVSDLFLNSLIDLITLKSSIKERIEIDNHCCDLEEQTDKGNRIDLLISSQNINTKKRDGIAAIIIENKIFSGLHNDLEDYYHSTKAQTKIGILLTLRPHQIPPLYADKFINITHVEWVTQIKANGLPTGLSINEYVYINDFINNMENLTDSNVMNQDARFFFEYSSKVLRAKQTYEAAYNYIISQLKILSEKLEWTFYGNSWNWRHIWDAKNQSHVYFSIILEKAVASEPEITIYLEIYKDALKMEAEFRQVLSDNNIYAYLEDDKIANNSWAHLAFKTYKLKMENLENLSTYLYEQIQKDFIPAYNLISLTKK